jgi:hypothetical protein
VKAVRSAPATVALGGDLTPTLRCRLRSSYQHDGDQHEKETSFHGSLLFCAVFGNRGPARDLNRVTVQSGKPIDPIGIGETSVKSGSAVSHEDVRSATTDRSQSGTSAAATPGWPYRMHNPTLAT